MQRWKNILAWEPPANHLQTAGEQVSATSDYCTTSESNSARIRVNRPIKGSNSHTRKERRKRIFMDFKFLKKAPSKTKIKCPLKEGDRTQWQQMGCVNTALYCVQGRKINGARSQSTCRQSVRSDTSVITDGATHHNINDSGSR